MPAPTSTIKILSNTQFTAQISATQGIDVNSINASTANIPDVTLTNAYASNAAEPVTFHSDVVIEGTLTATGSATLTNTIFETTSAIVVHNYGTGPGLTVSQEGENAIAAFYDHESTVALWVDGTTERPGFVGVKTETPNKELTVVGNISASGMIYGKHDLSTSYKGVYSDSTQYVESDIVVYNGSTYICVLANDGSNNVDASGNYYISGRNPASYNVDQPVGTSDKNWQILSPSGQTGETGVQGATGVVGEAGSNGSNGDTGWTGSTGETGVQGATGVEGATGWTGEAGPSGATGEAGPAGADGNVGATGSTGETGWTGVQGTIGDTGATGWTGVQGSTGETGMQGATGAEGATGYTGVAGPDGATGWTGAQGESGVNGATGDTGATGWTGVQGATGETGVNGTNGSDGATGVQGPTGETGMQGATGAEGATGYTGWAGPTGETGMQGATGVDGMTGDTGVTGVQGATGWTGEQGQTGDTGETGATGDTGVTYSLGVGTVSASQSIITPTIDYTDSGSNRYYNFTFPLWNRKYSETIGNGVNTSYEITHTISSPDVIISVRDLDTKELVIPSLVVTDETKVTVEFAEPPQTNQYRVTVIG